MTKFNYACMSDILIMTPQPQERLSPQTKNLPSNIFFFSLKQKDNWDFRDLMGYCKVWRPSFPMIASSVYAVTRESSPDPIISRCLWEPYGIYAFTSCPWTSQLLAAFSFVCLWMSGSCSCSFIPEAFWIPETQEVLQLGLRPSNWDNPVPCSCGHNCQNWPCYLGFNIRPSTWHKCSSCCRDPVS